MPPPRRPVPGSRCRWAATRAPRTCTRGCSRRSWRAASGCAGCANRKEAEDAGTTAAGNEGQGRVREKARDGCLGETRGVEVRCMRRAHPREACIEGVLAALGVRAVAVGGGAVLPSRAEPVVGRVARRVPHAGLDTRRGLARPALCVLAPRALEAVEALAAARRALTAVAVVLGPLHEGKLALVRQ